MTASIATIEMGARQYVPIRGRFLSVDPVAGGNSNDYNYPDDPVNGNDLTGKKMLIDGDAQLAYQVDQRIGGSPGRTHWERPTGSPPLQHAGASSTTLVQKKQQHFPNFRCIPE
ncbi:MAG: RHS repeat-associated core domain-containing protein [Galbitalea sp.]